MCSKQKIKKCGYLGMCFFLTVYGYLYAATDVKFKVLVVNPSESKNTKTVISQALPPEIDPNQDLIDKAGLDVKFDADKKIYLLTKEVELKPKETRVFEVRVRDVWVITPDQIEDTKKNLEAQIVALNGTKHYETAKLLFEKAQEGLDRILEEQSKPLGVKQHIELYRAHVQQLRDIKASALSLDAMRRLEEETKKGVNEAKFVIEAENPASEPKTITVRSLLPKEIAPEDVLDKQDFGILYDQLQKTYALEKKDQFAAREKKKYIITVKDIWRISDEDISFLKDQTEKLVSMFKDSPYAEYTKDQGKMILDLLSEIAQLQTEVSSSLSLEERMRAYVLNTQKLELVKAKIHNVQQLLPEITVDKDEAKLSDKLKLLIKKLAETKELVMVAMGLKPDTPATWWLILGIIAFLAVLTTIFYFTWIKKLQDNKWGKKVAEVKKDNAVPEPEDMTSMSSPPADEKK